MRIFIAIQLDDEVRKHIGDMADMLDPYFEKARYSRMENYHITVKFIGETDRRTYLKVVDATKRAAVRCRDFTMKTTQPGSFKRKKRHIFYCGTEYTQGLYELDDAVSEEIQKSGIEIQKTKLVPHITIAREVVLKEDYPEISMPGKEIKVDSISVMESTRINGKLTYIPRFTAKLGRHGND